MTERTSIDCIEVSTEHIIELIHRNMLLVIYVERLKRTTNLHN